jgi:hypothetical protein
MAIGLTDHVWSYREYIWLPVHADPVLRRQMDERIECLLTPALPGYPVGSPPVNLPPTEARRRKAQSLPKAA